MSSPNPVTESYRRRVGAAFWHAGAVQVDTDETFALASGNRSPIYVNCRVLISDPAFMRLFTEAARAVLSASGVTYEAIAGGETAGIPYAAYLASSTERPLLYVRKRAKDYGVASKVEGRVEPGWRVLLVEDLITDGGSKIGFVEALRAAGAQVADALVLFDRQQGGQQTLAGQSVALHSVTDRTTTLDVGESEGALTAQARQEVVRYFADPAAWHAARGFDFHSS